jgi:RNA polymerase sigma-70 factor, ECF subfamily
MMHSEPAEVSFRKFFLAEFPRLVSMLTVWSGDRALAEDLAQSALLQAERNWASVAVADKPGAWVRRVALNASSNERRRRAREDRAILRLGHRVDQAERETEPVDSFLWEQVRMLPRAQRVSVVLRYVDDLPLADIAAVLGCSEGTVKTHLQRARSALAAHLTNSDRLGYDR